MKKAFIDELKVKKGRICHLLKNNGLEDLLWLRIVVSLS
jgi:hypothetical protein